MRSILLVRGDDGDRSEQALGAGADALLIELPDNLEDASRLEPACRLVRTAQLAADRPLLFVRVPSIETPAIDAALATLMAVEPDAIVLGRSRGGQDVQHLGVKLAVQEAQHDLADGETPIIAEAAATAGSLSTLNTYCDASPRLMGLVWDAQVLAADLDLSLSPGNDLPAPLVTARSLLLLAARAAEVSAIDGPSDLTGEAFLSACEQARRDGFNAKIASRVDQVSVINAAFEAF